MKKTAKTVLVTLAILSLTNTTVQARTDDAFTHNYQFTSGADYGKELGKPTETNIVPQPAIQNTQNNKDASYNPPPYGVFSGDIDTERSNPYFSPKNYSTIRDVTSDTGSSVTSTIGGLLPSTSLMGGTTTTTGNVTINQSTVSQKTVTPPSSNVASKATNTAPLYYEDNSIGTLSIPRYGVKVKVYEGESLANLAKGLGHFSFTSAWDGNIGVAGHNDQEFKNLKNLNVGDEIIYETKYGKRTYVMKYRAVIAEDDFSSLDYSSSNRLTLITCVEGKPTQRYAVTAVEK